MEATYKVEGMTCGGCAASVAKAIQRVSPELQVDVKLEGGRVTVRGDHEAEQVKQAVEGAGFDFVGETARHGS